MSGTSVSPELVLVDPSLAESARKRLPAPPDTLEALGAVHAGTMPAPAGDAVRPRRRPSRVMTALGVVVVLAATAFLVGSRADVDETPAAPLTASAEPQPRAADTRPSEPVNESEARRRSPRQSTGTGARRFAWPPAAGASGYRVELFKGSALILRDQTKKPEILIRTRWRFNGRRHRLGPGAYRWYVWPVVAGQRADKAIVQAKLVVPR